MANNDTKPSNQDSNLLEETALDLYKDLLRGSMSRFKTEAVAAEAFAQAAPFVEMAKAIRNGKPIPKLRKLDQGPKEKVMVHLWDVNNKARFDDLNKPVELEMDVDNDAYAPNLSRKHPINQRFKARSPECEPVWSNDN